MEHEVIIDKPSARRAKIIKRYQNRKLYDTQQSCYVTLDDIAKMVRTNEEIMVIDNRTKSDITAATLTQIIFEAEKRASQYSPLFTLRDIIQSGNSSISNYLAKLGVFPQDYAQKQTPVMPVAKDNLSKKTDGKKGPFDSMKPGFKDCMTHSGDYVMKKNQMSNLSNLGRNGFHNIEVEELPNLPNSNKNFNNSPTD